MKKLIILSMLTTLFISSNGQNVKRELIDYEYFKLPRPNDAQFDAFLFYNILYKYKVIHINSSKLSITFKVNVEFVREKSYFPASKLGKDSVLLKHEQGHADIVILNANKILNKLTSSTYSPKDYKQKIEILFKEGWKQTGGEQIIYDNETSHGLNKACQEEWNQKFDAAFN